MMKKIVSYLTIISLLLITFSCGGGGSSKGVSSVTVLASFESFKSKSTSQKAASSTLTNIRYTVTGSGMDIMTDTVPVTGNLVEFTLNVPNGPQRHFLIEALDSSNTVRYKGEAYRDLDGTPVTIEIILASTISSVIVIVNPAVIEPGGKSTITASVNLNTGGPASDGTIVNFATTCGSVTPFAQTASGVATAEFTAPSIEGTCTITATAGGVSSSVDVLVQFSTTTTCLTGTWTSIDLPSISMSLNQVGSTVTGNWVNSNTGCAYTGSGSYNSSTTFLTITFTTGMNPVQCCQSFTYNGTVSNCNSMSLGWTNNCSFSGGRQY